MESHRLLFLKVAVGLVIPQVPCHKGHKLCVCTIVICPVLCVVLLKSSPEALPSSSAENQKNTGQEPRAGFGLVKTLK